jgi:phosphoglycerol transferase MdoB-like AlkP superfamily enzyme
MRSAAFPRARWLPFIRISSLGTNVILALILIHTGIAWWKADLAFAEPARNIYWHFIFFSLSIVWVTNRFWLALLLVSFVSFSFNYANKVKISITTLPVNYFDFKILFMETGDVIQALGAQRLLALLTILGLALLTVVMIRTNLKDLVRITVATAVVVLCAGFSFVQSGNLFRDIANQRYDLWEPAGQVNIAKELGFLNYLALTFALEREHRGLIFGPRPTGDPSHVATAQSVEKFVTIRKDDLLPNIVVMLAESTFDPNTSFNLITSSRNLLWTPRHDTKLMAPLRVNVVGGGTWVSEFESITGLDSRLFGYMGFYTNYTVAPLIRDSLAHHLARKGYRTAAFYPVSGEDWNARAAYRHYGFESFVDSSSLELTDDWIDFSDASMIEKIRSKGYFSQSGPFFYYIATLQNHGPHVCRSTPTPIFRRTGSSTDDLEADCILSDYLDRARSTSAGFAAIIEALEEQQRTTGRPFVVAMFGDHLPWSFTGGDFSIAGGTAIELGNRDFSSYRTDIPENITILHVVSSVKDQWRPNATRIVPITLLPSILSAFAAEAVDDVYLPINFYSLDRCGADFLTGCASKEEIVSNLRSLLK